MTESGKPNWPNAPKTLIDAWFVTVPILYVHFSLYAMAFKFGAPRFLNSAGFFAHLAMMMSFDALVITQFFCLNVVSRESEVARWEKIVWWMVLLLIPPVAVPAYYLMRMRPALFDLDVPKLEPLPKFVAGFIQLFIDVIVLQFAVLPVMGALLLVTSASAMARTLESPVHPLFALHWVLAFAGALWAVALGVMLCLRRLFAVPASRHSRIGWTVFLLMLAPIGIAWFYFRKLRRYVGGVEHLRKSLVGRILFVRLFGRKRKDKQ